jgi:hypothetical protein
MRQHTWLSIFLRESISLFLIIPVLSIAVPLTASTAAPPAATPIRVVDTYGNLPLHFEANQGQTDSQVQFLARSGGSTEAFVTQLNPLGNGLVDSTYLGGSSNEFGLGIAVDGLPTPNAYVTGFAASTDFPTTTGAFQTTFGGGPGDAFMTKITDIVLPPPPTAAKVTGGGSIDVIGGLAPLASSCNARPRQARSAGTYSM